MSLFPSNDTAQFLASLETRLQQDPVEGDQGLTEIPKTLNELIERDQLDICESAVKILGDALGKQRAWQHEFQISGVLAFVLERLDALKDPVEVTKQYLRVIGNCVSDNDETREDAVVYLEKIITCLQRDELRVTALAVTFNLCNDSELAQAQCANLRLDNTIADLLAGDKISEDAIEYAASLMTWTTTKLNIDQITDATSLSVFDNLLDTSIRTEDEVYYDFVTICAHYLEIPPFQKKLMSVEILNKILDLVLDFESKLTFEEMKEGFKALSSKQDSEEVPLEEQNIALLVQLIHSLSTISALGTFGKQFEFESTLVGRLINKVRSEDVTPSTVLACVMLGNLATLDSISTDLVENKKIHIALARILSKESYPALLYAAAGFMRHLAFPVANRDVLGEVGLVETCGRLLSNKDPSVRGEAAAILCKLVTGSLQNVKKVVYDAIPDGVVPFQVSGTEAPQKPTLLYCIITQAFAPSAPVPSTSMKNASIEIGRLEIAMLRTLERERAATDITPILIRMYQTPLIVRPVALLVRQRFFAEARSEGLLGLGLMAQTEEGAAAVVKEIEAEDGLLEAIEELAVSQFSESAKQVDFEIRRDPQNAIVLLHGLETNAINVIDESLKSKIDSLRVKLERVVIG